MIVIKMIVEILSLIFFASILFQDIYASPPLKDKSERNIKKQAKRRARYNLTKAERGSEYEKKLKYMKGRYADLKNEPMFREKYQEMLQNSRIRSSSRRLNIKYDLPRGTLPGGKYDHKEYFGKYKERTENQERVKEFTTTSVLLSRQHQGLGHVMKTKADEPRRNAIKANEEMWKIYKKGVVPDNSQQTNPDQNELD